MSKREFKFKDIKITGTRVRVKVDMSRFEKQFQEAQYYLDSQVMTDMVPYMPSRTHAFINLVRARSAALAGSGTVIAGVPPSGRFLYEGKVMIDPVTGSPWARKDAKKVVTNRPLIYSNPQATPHWFDTAKERHGKQWVEKTKRIAGGG